MSSLTFMKNPGKIQAWEKSKVIAEQDMDRALAVLKIIWMALLGSLAVYWIIGQVVAPGLTSELSGEAFRMLRVALYALGLATPIAAGYVRRLILAAGGPAQARPVLRAAEVFERRDRVPGHERKRRGLRPGLVPAGEERHGSLSADRDLRRRHVPFPPQEGRTAQPLPAGIVRLVASGKAAGPSLTLLYRIW